MHKLKKTDIMTLQYRIVYIFALLLLTLLISACGGSGGSSTSHSAPTPAPTPTPEPDNTPDPIEFTLLEPSAPPGKTILTNVITVSGVNMPIRITVIEYAEVSVNGEPFTSDVVFAENGDTIQLRFTTPNAYNQALSSGYGINDASIEILEILSSGAPEAESIIATDTPCPSNPDQANYTYTIDSYHKTNDGLIVWDEDTCWLTIYPNWGESPSLEWPFDYVTVLKDLNGTFDLSSGVMALSLYLPNAHLGNPWGTGDFWDSAAHTIGINLVLADANGQRAVFALDNQNYWINAFQLHEFLDAEDWNLDYWPPELPPEGYWYKLELELAVNSEKWSAGDEFDESLFDISRVTSAGVSLHFAYYFPDNRENSDYYTNGFPETPFMLDNLSVRSLVANSP